MLRHARRRGARGVIGSEKAREKDLARHEDDWGRVRPSRVQTYGNALHAGYRRIEIL